MMSNDSTLLNVSFFANTIMITNRSDIPWSIRSYYIITLCVLVVIANATVLAAYLKSRTLRNTTFSYYLMFLLGTNIFQSAIQQPIELTMVIYRSRIISQFMCGPLLYVTYFSYALLMQCQVLITSNRVWAVTFPYSYKVYHSKRVAVVLCTCSVLFVNAVVLPGFIFDRLYYHVLDGACTFALVKNSYQIEAWGAACEILLYISPAFIIVLAYPWIVWKRQQQLRKMAGNKLFPTSATDGAAINKNPETSRTDSRLRREVPTQQVGKTSQSFRVYSMITAVVALCWTPTICYHGLTKFAYVDVKGLRDVAGYFWGLQPLLDPIFFALSLGELRRELSDMLESCLAPIKKRVAS